MIKFKLTLAAGTVFLAFTTAANTELSKNACDYIELYESIKGEGSFPDLVAHMAHDVEYCHSPDGCDNGLKKRTGPIQITLDNGSSEAIRKIFDANLAYTVNIVRQLSGLKFYLDEHPETVTGIIHILLVGDVAETNLTSFEPEFFSKFLKSEKLTCLVTNFDWPNAEIEYSEVWIKTSISPEMFANCVKEEIFNASGVPGDPIGLDSLISKDTFSSEIFGPPIFQNFDGRALIAMQLVYLDEMVNGQSRARTREVARQSINKFC
ncbi:hypothetical protein AB1A64_06695 [Ruegeria sp. ANG10]|uniref:hypothetical protein n=1 Tax=Ruegeria sp. ANG10 TaxID=3042467 RepID=UPI003456CBE6